jgi:glutamine amidotransferase
MGWNQVRWRRSSAISANIPDNSFFYFVHSYYAEAGDNGDILGSTDYGIEFTSVACRETAKIFAVQFHPEKSQAAGLRLLNNFAEM